MTAGKQISQAAHASLGAFMEAKKTDREKWTNEGMKKIILKVGSEIELLELYELVNEAKLPHQLVSDKGLTQVKSGTITALGIGPAPDAKIDKITGKLKLL